MQNHQIKIIQYTLFQTVNIVIWQKSMLKKPHQNVLI